MRFVRFLGILLVVVTAQVSYGQSSSENAYTNHNPNESVHIFPIPATEYLHVKIDDVLATHVKLTLHNILGNAVEIETEIVDQHELRIKVKELAAGYYLLAIKDDESKYGRIFKVLKR
jgi:hypothetical protein